MDRVSIERMCAGRELQVEGADTEKAPRGKVASNVGSGGLVRRFVLKERKKIARHEFRQVERLRGVAFSRW